MKHCKRCHKFYNHFHLMKPSSKYYTCYWCKTTLLNTIKNRREHGIKCNKRPVSTEICHCINICVTCLETGPCQYFSGCGCLHCNQCDPGYGQNFDTCNRCDLLITWTFIQWCCALYERIKVNHQS